MNAKTLTVAIFAIGALSAFGQSNPDSSGAVDTETELSWPDGTVYFSSINDNDGGYVLTDYLPVTWSAQVNWGQASGGSFVGQSYSDGNWNNNLPSGIWPESIYGLSTAYGYAADYDFAYWPQGFQWQVYFGSASGSDAEGAYSYNDTPELEMLTGGAPGATGYELYEIQGAVILEFNETNIASQKVQIGGLGKLGSNGILWVVLPTHSKVAATPSGGQFYVGGATATPYKLVSQCVSPIPADRSRTTIGVGEQVNLSFSPTLPTNAVWSTTAGSLSYITNTSTQFTAPDGPTNVTVTAAVGGTPFNIPFDVIAPTGMVTATIIGTNHYPVGWVGAGMTNRLTFFPTNVSFYRVQIIESTTFPTNIMGFFTNYDIGPLTIGSDLIYYDNTIEDHVSSSYQLDPPIYPGSFELNTPIAWSVEGSSETNSMSPFNRVARLLDGSGDFSNTKYGITITRYTNDFSFSTQ